MVETTYTVPNAPRLALLSDLHGRPYQEVIRSVQNFRPEMICITGYLITGILPENELSPLQTQQNVRPFLQACVDIALTFVSLGNHEQVLDEADRKTIRNTGVILLDNTWIGKDNCIIDGLTSACVTDYRKAKPKDTPLRYPKVEHIQRARIPEIAWLVDFAKQEGFHILLSHYPEHFPLIPQSIELMLSGHAHGDQIRLFGRGLFALGQG
jgi:hypothetical protein